MPAAVATNSTLLPVEGRWLRAVMMVVGYLSWQRRPLTEAFHL
jgi:hypothetical protein